jgi:hypothetical protein
MATISEQRLGFIIPVKDLQSPSSWGSRASIKGMIDKIAKNYGSFFKFASRESGIPEEILIAFCAVESGGNPTAGGAGHITQGLMQWNRNYAKSQLETEYAKGRLSVNEKNKLAQFGIKFNAQGKTRDITNADQLKPELNILIGTIILGQLIDTPWGREADMDRATEYAKQLINEAKADGRSLSYDQAIKIATNRYYKLRLDRVIAVYNAGAYGSTGQKARNGNHKTPAELAADVNPVTASYIRKMMGTNGALDVATNDFQGGLV